METRQWPWIQSSLPFMGMVSAVVALATSMIISKMAMSKGISFYILSLYSNGVATLILFPTAFLLHRSKRPPLSFPVLCRIFLLASLGCSADIVGYAGLNYSSPTLSSAMVNLVPAFTYILAIIFRMEDVHLRKLSTISKFLGTLVSISGAFIVTFYKGPAIIGTMLTSGSSTLLYLRQTPNWVLGGLLTACACLLTASWCILQALILKMYPAEMIVVAIYCFLVTIQSSVVSLIAERDSTVWRIETKIGLIAVLYMASILKMYPAEMIVVAFYCCFVTIQSSLVSLIAERDLTAWRIQTKIGLIAVFYSAIINIAYRLYVTAWCLWRTGPLFVALFKPLTIVIAIVIGVIFMKDILYLGSLIGALVLIFGFYAVMWGKAKEGELNKGTESSGYEAPLLQENVEGP
ncbi:WAT1-related protein [Sesamum alatum]|uniref:WAT1-related protein n=1 Tax=Sesamum alatum TaxID=300844 RepID=A0AAE1YGZ2_9LAMI|nr:WAT1-related protein [Sesamum alatum]